MSRLGSLKYDFIIYTSLFIAFICAIASCISPSQAVSETPVVEKEETEDETVGDFIISVLALGTIGGAGGALAYFTNRPKK